MAKSDTKIIYEEDEDILVLSKDKAVKASIDIGEFVIDIDANGFIVGIEILNASESVKLPVEKLKEIQKASMFVTYKPNHVYIYLLLKFEEKEKDIAIPLAIDLGHGKIKTQETVFAAA